MRAGVVLSGGRSTRFGDRDKAVADLAGTPMIRRVVDRIGTAVDELVVNCREDQVDAIAEALDGSGFDPTFALDRTPDEGPMAGIRYGLDAATAEYAVVVACDMPFVDPDVVESLFERAAGADAAVPRPDEWYQTTQAVYATEPAAPPEVPREEPLDAAGGGRERGHPGEVVDEVGRFGRGLPVGTGFGRVSHRIHRFERDRFKNLEVSLPNPQY